MYCLSKEENFRFIDIMCSSNNVHLSNQNMKCSTGVALYKGIKCFWKEVDVEQIYAKKRKIFSFCVITSSYTHRSSLLKEDGR